MDADDEIGSLQVGKRADIISVAGNPLEDISALSDVRLVMKNGWRLDPILGEHLVRKEREMSRGMIELKGSHTAVRICSNVEPGETVVIITTVLENLTYYLGDL